MNRLVVAILFAYVCRGQTLSVCNVLGRLAELNEAEVSIRGVFGVGDTGEALIAIPACRTPTTSDGWKWRDAISVLAEKNSPFTRGGPEYQRTKGINRNSKIVATLTGRFETQKHFDIHRLPDGSGWPMGFGYFVAFLRYRTVRDVEAVPFAPGEHDLLLEVGRKPYATPSK